MFFVLTPPPLLDESHGDERGRPEGEHDGQEQDEDGQRQKPDRLVRSRGGRRGCGCGGSGRGGGCSGRRRRLVVHRVVVIVEALVWKDKDCN